MRINHNISALNTYNKMQKNSKAITGSMQKLSSGQRINQAADDAAGLSISEKMRAQIRGLEQAEQNIQNGISLLQTAEGGLGEIVSPNLQRLRELAVQASNDTLTTEDKQTIQKEIEQIKQGINDIANDTEFNEIKPLIPGRPEEMNGSSSGKKAKVDIVFLVDYSGSMGNANNSSTQLGAVSDGISDFVTELDNNSMDAQVGIVNITTTRDPLYKPLSDNPETIKQNMKRLGSTLVNSGTKPYQYMEEATPTGEIGEKLGYRSDSKKVFVLFTDVGNENGTGTENTAKEALEGSNISYGFDDDDIQSYVFGFSSTMNGSYDETDKTAYDDIVNYTGGKLYTTGISNSDQIKDKLKNDLVTDIHSNIGNSDNEFDETKTIKL
ncbi:flagellin N-terminal helical domain-containing protein [Lentibacillus sp. Marseille-P4043]|uniref:flagellin N-terminal helical domain-containing protein n=1 Tax=Lentibacillus sp. Marseille-P4043 TaxID=2040293 RepID=UPI000D0B1FC0|nr:VWA domain-containing protein [Lentibacillus sp. Marseille-P4043]